MTYPPTTTNNVDTRDPTGSKNLDNQELESGAMLYCSRTGLKSHHRDNPLQGRACTMLFHVNMLPADTS